MGGRIWRKLAASLCVAVLGALAFSLPAVAAGQTITVWWNQGFYAAEDQAMKEPSPSGKSRPATRSS